MSSPPLKSPLEPLDEPTQAQPVLQAPAYKLFKIAGIGWATFCGMPLGGGVLLALNSRRLGNRKAARQQLGVSALTSVALGLPGLLATSSLGLLGQAAMRGVGIGTLFAIIAYARHAQGSGISMHRAIGGRFESNWKALAVGLTVFLGEAVFVLFVVLILVKTGLLNID